MDNQSHNCCFLPLWEKQMTLQKNVKKEITLLARQQIKIKISIVSNTPFQFYNTRLLTKRQQRYSVGKTMPNLLQVIEQQKQILDKNELSIRLSDPHISVENKLKCIPFLSFFVL